MKIAAILAVLFGVLVGPRARAEESRLPRPQWLIAMTMIDRATGKQLYQSTLTDHALVFDDLGACNSIIARVPPLGDNYTIVVLTCRQAVSVDAEL